jgi:hypothetical protein
MNTTSISPRTPAERYCLSTEAFAARYHVAAQTVRKRYAATSAYFDIRPLSLPNGRLLWPDDSIEVLIEAKLGGAA